MTDINKPDPDNYRYKKGSTQLWQYAGIGGQLLVSLGIGVFLGLKADEWLNFTIPLFVWILPLLILIAMIAKLIKATSRKK
ncbi:MAG: AtpZ/AtpI family protein [Chitinophagaceae bacterium]|nr:AtpZ/AtpI family protein [Chitinophagaceae bacterium]